ncbi:Disease resistance protein adr1 [Thalictrum thalictroides]|uniref:Disease resistance protein adr1 n=1 Tax=Thalictrum thalictroides TaxID=46969 RepID=A0A7J6W8Y3_THATH|nr:Disease resistance protein adr1 [Thalictrum thalictroides]
MVYINELLPIIEEIKYSGVELPQVRQHQLDSLSETLRSGRELATKVLLSNRWNVYKNLVYARKMEKLEKNISRFLNGTLPVHVLADVHHMRVGLDKLEEKIGLDRLEERIGGLKIGSSEVGWVEESMRRKVEEEEKIVNLIGVGMVLAKKKVMEVVVGRDDLKVIGICGIGGSGKTTLATEISKDPQVKSHFNNRVFFVTVSQSPNVEYLKQKLWAQIAGNNIVGSPYFVPQWLQPDWGTQGRTLVILDDVWSLSDLEQLVFSIPGCKTLAVSRFKYPKVFNWTFDVELLREDEAMSLFCHSAFGQQSLPIFADRNLVEQVVKECKGLPLALKVIGASLRDQPQMFWTSAKNRLSRGEPICESHATKLLDRMAISIEFLPPKVKECFLDLASFPEDKKIPLDVLINMWVEIHDLDEEEAFAILVELSDKNLITLVKDARAGDTYSSYFEIFITEHDVLRDMALHYNNGVSLNERWRLLMPRREEGLPKEWERNMDKPFQARIVSCHTGEMKEGDWFPMEFPMAEVLILNFSSNEFYLPPFIERMPNLKALVLINYGNCNTVLHNFSVFSSMSKLRSLWLEKIVIPSVPDITVPIPNLRKISLVLCEFVKRLDGTIVYMPLILPRLLELTMDHCTNLNQLPSSVCTFSSLKILGITNCHDLQNLPNEIGQLKSLQILRFCSCPALEQLPQSICGLEKLKYLDISQCVNLTSLPERIGGLIMLEKIDMRECSQIRSVPASAVSLRRLRRVICDEEASWLWKEIERVVPDLWVEVAEECFNLDWLAE